MMSCPSSIDPLSGSNEASPETSETLFAPPDSDNMETNEKETEVVTGIASSGIVSDDCFEQHDLAKEHIDALLELHQQFPPLHKPSDKESKVPATDQKLEYFSKALMLKREKFHEILARAVIPKVLKSVPFALSYQSFVLSYWPGPLFCCNRPFGATRHFCKHLYDRHMPPQEPPNLSCVASVITPAPSSEEESPKTDELSTITTSSDHLPQISIDPPTEERLNDTDTVEPIEEATELRADTCITSPTSIRDDTVESKAPTRRKSLNTVDRPSPLRAKVPRELKNLEMESDPLSLVGHESASSADRKRSRLTSDSSFEALNESTDDKNGGVPCKPRPKRSCTKRSDFDDSTTLDISLGDRNQVDELIEDQQRYIPQHDPGQSEDFVATRTRLDYFIEALRLKLDKYRHLASYRPRSPSQHIPLALALPGFVRYYWPGRVMCCGKVRENSSSLESHISRAHKPPKCFPKLSLISSGDSGDECPSETDSVAESSVDDSPPEELNGQVPKEVAEKSKSDRKKFPAEFSIDQDRYPPQHKMGDPEDFLANDESMSYFMEVFLLKSEKYAQITRHSKKPLGGSFASLSQHYWPGIVSCCGRVCDSVESFKTHIVEHHAPPAKTNPNLTVLSSPPKRLKENHLEEHNMSHEDSTVKGDNGESSPFYRERELAEEGMRSCRREMADVTDLRKMFRLLEKTLTQAMDICERVGTAGDRLERRLWAESLETAWNASKHGIVRWKELTELQDPYLAAVQYAYNTAPVFINWESRDHLAVVENVVRLTYATVRHLQSTMTLGDGKTPADPTRILDDRLVKSVIPRLMADSDRKDSAGAAAFSGRASGGGQLSVEEFCRLANVALSQKTKERSATDYKDDDGFYHPLYRYNSIVLMLKLYGPPQMTKLRCCGRVYTLAGIKIHVSKVHEERNFKCPPSLAPA